MGETVEKAESFTKDYHGHAFIDSQGENFRAVVCHAPYQKVPRAKSQQDPRDGTITDDPLYKEFVENLGVKAVFEAPDNPLQLIKPANPQDTPLIKYMQEKAKERKAKAEKRGKEVGFDGKHS